MAVQAKNVCADRREVSSAEGERDRFRFVYKKDKKEDKEKGFFGFAEPEPAAEGGAASLHMTRLPFEF